MDRGERGRAVGMLAVLVVTVCAPTDAQEVGSLHHITGCENGELVVHLLRTSGTARSALESSAAYLATDELIKVLDARALSCDFWTAK